MGILALIPDNPHPNPTVPLVLADTPIVDEDQSPVNENQPSVIDDQHIVEESAVKRSHQSHRSIKPAYHRGTARQSRHTGPSAPPTPYRSAAEAQHGRKYTDDIRGARGEGEAIEISC